jgi:hypothetical protein
MVIEARTSRKRKQGEPHATGQEETLLSHEIRLQADYTRLVRIEDLPVHL